MPLNTLNASSVIKDVLNRYEGYLPAGLAPKIRSMNPARIFRILPEAQYRPQFDEYYRNFFAAINTQAFGTAFVIGVANSPNDVCGSFNCPAFCAPAVNVTDRTIYINRDIAGATIGTLYHEFIHYLSHPNFYPEFYSMGGENPKILEGATEYLTRGVNRAVSVDRSSQGKYQQWLDLVTGRMGSSPIVERDLARLVFLGDLSILARVGGVRPRTA